MTAQEYCPFNKGQLEVIKAMADDGNAKRIGGKLRISHHTVHWRIREAKEIAEVSTSAGLVAFAMRHGWVK